MSTYFDRIEDLHGLFDGFNWQMEDPTQETGFDDHLRRLLYAHRMREMSERLRTLPIHIRVIKPTPVKRQGPGGVVDSVLEHVGRLGKRSTVFPMHQNQKPATQHEIIEGEYQVLDEDNEGNETDQPAKSV